MIPPVRRTGQADGFMVGTCFINIDTTIEKTYNESIGKRRKTWTGKNLSMKVLTILCNI